MPKVSELLEKRETLMNGFTRQWVRSEEEREEEEEEEEGEEREGLHQELDTTEMQQVSVLSTSVVTPDLQWERIFTVEERHPVQWEEEEEEAVGEETAPLLTLPKAEKTLDLLDRKAFLMFVMIRRRNCQ